MILVSLKKANLSENSVSPKRPFSKLQFLSNLYSL